MDNLGKRLVHDPEIVRQKRLLADRLEREAREHRRNADEIERLAELARFQRV